MATMTFDEWLKSPGRHERLVKIKIQPGVEVEAICRVNSKKEFMEKLEMFQRESSSAWNVFSGEWFDAMDHSKRLFANAEEMESRLSQEMIDILIEEWTMANTGKSVKMGELTAPALSPVCQSEQRGGYSAKSSGCGILTTLKRWFLLRR